jgi:hypothetical protein
LYVRGSIKEDRKGGRKKESVRGDVKGRWEEGGRKEGREARREGGRDEGRGG